MNFNDSVHNGNIPEEERGGVSQSFNKGLLSKPNVHYLSLILKTATSPTLMGSEKFVRNKISPR